MALTIQGYKNILENIFFWKRHLLIQYRDVEFKFQNTGLGNNGASKLTVSGITPDIPAYTITLPGFGNILPQTISRDRVIPREYVIYTELRGINLERWNVRIPYIVGSSEKFNTLENNPNIPSNYRLEAGLGYDFQNEIGGDIPGLLPMFSRVNSSGNSLTFTFESDRSYVASSTRLRSDINRLLTEYDEHPCITLYTTTTNANSQSRKFYNVIPIGVDKYKVKLELANGENISRLFDANWNPL